ncbi:unnamed protein product, partial [Symbiodinium pilosum]
LGSRPCVRQTALYKRHESGNAMKALLGAPHLFWDPADHRAEVQKPIGERRRRFLPRKEEDKWEKVTSSAAGKGGVIEVKQKQDPDEAKGRRPAPQRSAIGAAGGRIVTRSAAEKAAIARHGSGSVAECLTMQ